MSLCYFVAVAVVMGLGVLIGGAAKLGLSEEMWGSRQPWYSYFPV